MVLHIRKVIRSKFLYRPMRSTKNRPAIDTLDRPDLDNWLRDVSEVASPMCQLAFTPRKIPGTCLC
jgi:hypothetical protein